MENLVLIIPLEKALDATEISAAIVTDPSTKVEPRRKKGKKRRRKRAKETKTP
jgi:hypothetical protein